METTTEEPIKVSILSLKGRLDGSTVNQADTALQDRLDKGRVNILVDMSRLEYISSAGLKLILSILKKARELDGKLVLFGLTGHVREVFEFAGLMEVIPIAASKEEALAIAKG